MRAAASRRASAVLASDVEAFERSAGCRLLERTGPHEARLEAPGDLGRVVLRLRPIGQVFGGSWGMELAPETPLLPPTERGLAARGRGVVRQQGVAFRARARGDAHGDRLAGALTADAALGEALGRVHFEEVVVRPDGTPVIRHLGGSVMWILLPPIVRPTPLPDGQARELLRALSAFRRAGRLAAGAGAGPARSSRS